MVIVTVSSLGWQHHRAAVGSLLSRLVRQPAGETVLLDFDTIERERGLVTSDVHAPELEVVDFSDWVRDGQTADGVLDVPAVRRAASAIAPSKVAVIDATGHRFALIEEALAHLRQGWFPLEQWHPAFVLVCDDALLFQATPPLSTTFYCQPEIMTPRETLVATFSTLRASTLVRWLGPGFGRWQAKLHRRIERYQSEREHRILRREDRRA